MRQSLPFPWETAPSVTANFIHSAEAEYFYKDVVWEIVDHDCGSMNRNTYPVNQSFKKGTSDRHTRVCSSKKRT